ncbi:MAG: pilus assembly protein PilO [Cyanobacteriota bacterium]|nr:pilus assembly protein PilO [Cyanobacteriota bacterium]
MVVANEWDPELEEEEEGEESGFQKLVKDPKVIGIGVGVLGAALAGWVVYSSVMPAVEKGKTLNEELEAAKAKIVEQKRQIQERPKAEAALVEAQENRNDVTRLFASDRTMETLLYDINKLVDTINSGITDEEKMAKMTRFNPEISQDGNYVVNDGSLGPLVNGKLKRRKFKVEFEGSYPQTRAFTIAIERMQPLLVVKNLRTQLDQQGETLEVEWKEGKFIPIDVSPNRLRTSFDLHALLALSEEESLGAEEETEEEKK